MSLSSDATSDRLQSFSPDTNWTFEHALNLLNLEAENCLTDPQLTNSLDSFLKQNQSVFTSIGKRLPFSLKTPETGGKDLPESVDLRGLKFHISGLSDMQKSCVKEVSKLLNIESLEAARITTQLTERLPNGESMDNNETSSFSNSDRLKNLLKTNEQSETSCLYITAIVSEQRSILQILIRLLNLEDLSSYKTAASIVEFLVGEVSIEALLESLEILVDSLVKIAKAEDEDSLMSFDQLESTVFYENALLLLDALQLLTYLILKSRSGLQKNVVMKWFSLMKKTGYMSHIEYPAQFSDNFNGTNSNVNRNSYIENYRDVSSAIEALSTIISLTLLDLDFNSNTLNDDNSFINSKDLLTSITNDCILNETTPCENSVVLYSWGIILHRKFVLLTESGSTDATFTDFLQNGFNECASRAQSLDFVSSTSRCYSLLQFDNIYANILGTFVVAFMPYITLTDEIATLINQIMTQCSESVLTSFFMNPSTEDIITLQRAKIPINLKKFIRLVGLNSNLAIEEFTNLRSYMEVFEEEDFYYKYRIDDGNPDLISITQDIDIVPPYEKPGELSLLLKEGTKGQLMPGAGKDKAIVAFLYEYNGWSLLGRILKNISKNTFDSTLQSIAYKSSVGHNNTYEVDTENLELVVEILKLLTKVLNNSENEVILKVLKSMSAYIDDTNDIIEVIFRIMNQACSIRNIDVLVACLNLFSSLCENGYSYRVWSYLYTSHLLGFKASDGMANNILGSVEMISGKYDFSIALFELTEILIHDCLLLDNDMTSNKLKSEVVEGLVVYIVRVFENHSNWRYVEKYQKFKCATLAMDICNKIIISVYGIDAGNKQPELKITKVFSKATRRIASTFLVPDLQDLSATRPILNIIDSLSSSSMSPVASNLTGYWKSKFYSLAFEYSSNLIAVRSVYQDSNASTFEMILFARVPNLIDIYARYLNLRPGVLQLLTNLVNGSWKGEPPSLLTHLDQNHANILLHSLATDMKNNLESNLMKVSLYDFFASVMKGNQQGLSTVFITGRDIKEWLLDKKKSTESKKRSEYSLLKILKTNVSMISHFPNSVALHLVDAIALAFNTWNTVKEEGDDQEFIEKLLVQLKDLSKIDTSFSELDEELLDTKSYEEYTRACYELRLLSKISEILSLYLFVSTNDQCKAKIFEVLKSPDFVSSLEARFKIVGYKLRLASNADQEFLQNWGNAGLTLSHFKRTSTFKKNRYGTGAIYSFSLLDSYFAKDSQYWDLFRHKLVLASINYQFATAQISLAKSLGALVTCFCKTYPDQIPSHYLDLVSTLLRINKEEGIPDPLFESIYQERIELAFLICFLFSRTSKKNQFIKLSSVEDEKLLFTIISYISQLLMSHEVSFLSTLVSVSEPYYYKSLLRTLLIALKMIKPDSPLLVEYSATFADVFDFVASKSIKVICASVQNEAISYPNTDFSNNALLLKQIEDSTLILSIWKVFLSFKLSRTLENSISRSLTNSSTLSMILNLYSCSHLIKINNEEVFADLSLMYLYESVSVKFIAEKLISSGLYAALIESPMSVLIQKSSVVATSSSTANLHHLWSDGILSIVLTTLGMFNDRILDEVITFTKAFRFQFSSTLRSWFEPNSVISTAMIQETSQIIYLAKVLSSMDANAYVQNDPIFKDGLIPGLDTKEERHSFVTSLNYLISHPKYLTLRVAPINADQQRVIESGYRSKFTDELVEEIKQLRESLLD